MKEQKQYTAVNLGPISMAFQMAVKPREFWSASYMFSLLMEIVIDEFSKYAKLLSPSLKSTEKIGAGLYPDRAFFVSERRLNIQALRKDVIARYAEETGLSEPAVKDFFRIMIISMEASSECFAIKSLNEHLNYLELNTISYQDHNASELRCLIKNRKDSPLFMNAFGTKTFRIEDLQEIAEYELRTSFTDKRYSYHDYICIVQADGDGMGNVVNHLEDGKIQDLSSLLMAFGHNAVKGIKQFGGLPIYAGGDDLLFIAPVRGDKSRTILDLLYELDLFYKPVCVFAKKNGGFMTSMSYGISITYYKFPLYEAWRIAKNTLFNVAKESRGKNAIAWNLQKHSGSSYAGVYTKDTSIDHSFNEVIRAVSEQKMVSSVAHKLRTNEGLLSLLLKPGININTRLKSFFDVIVDVEGKTNAERQFLDSSRDLLKSLLENNVCENEGDDPEKKVKDLVRIIYAMLRTAKFINGEEERQ